MKRKARMNCISSAIMCSPSAGRTWVSCPGTATLVLLILALSLLCDGVILLEYDFPEESPIGTVVGNVKLDANLTSQYSGDELQRLRFLLRPGAQGQQRYFAVDDRTGDISTALTIDRETLCSYSVNCDLSFDVSVRPVEFYQIIKVVVHIKDINDNSPTFSKDKITLSIAETTPPGTKFMIPAAEDADYGILSVQNYRLVSGDDDDNADMFQLVVTDQVGGTNDILLKLVGRLDRETTDSYRFVVLAVDGGQPPKTGSIVCDIVVVDSNDNSPQFENSTYAIEIHEDLPAGSTLLRVRATDPDQGPNGEVRFSLADQTDIAYGQIFGIEDKTGNIYLKQPVDYEQYKSFVLTIQATDLGSGSLPVFAKVIVNVIDVNDNAPVITINVLTNSDSAHVRENAAPGTFVAHVAVKDTDSGPNGQVQCFIDNRSLFALEALYGSEYKITTVVSFDREENIAYELLLTCRDRGDVPLLSYSTIKVTVLDENDNSPDLGLASDPYELVVSENTRLNTSLVRINATDLDEGRNAALVYRLEPLGGDGREVLSIDSRTGNVFIKKNLDYEDRKAYRFLLNVSDRGAIPLSATATILLTVVDSNDESPVFDRSMYFLSVPENKLPGTVVGRVNASDGDVNPEYRRITYVMHAPSGVFEIDEQSGELTTLRRLDREEQDTYHFAVVASNPGYPGIETRVNVTVFVEDENDNSPVFLFPGRGVNRIELPGHSAVTGTVVTRLAATDRDVGPNAELVYDINNGNVDDLFHINHITGVITLTKNLQVPAPYSDQTHKLVVVAKDRGIPQLFCVADLTIVFNNSQVLAQTIHGSGESFFGSFVLDGQNVLILVGAGLGFVVVLTCVITTAVCVRRQRRLNARKRAVEKVEVSHLHCKSPTFSHRRSHADGSAGFGSYTSTNDTNSTHKSPGCALLQRHHVCECGDDGMMMRDGETSYIDCIPTSWSGFQQDSGIVANPDGLPVTSDSGDVMPEQLTPSSASSRCHGVSRTRSCSPHACYGHRCCSHSNRCGGGPGVPHRCRFYQSFSFRHASITEPQSHSESVRMLQQRMPILGQEASNCRDHDLESLESASTWTDSGRGPSEEEDRLRSNQQVQHPCLNCVSNIAPSADGPVLF